MIFIEPHSEIIGYTIPIDLRAGWVRLEHLVRYELKEDPLSGNIFVFINKRKDLMRFFYWDRTGYIMSKKKISHGRFGFTTDDEKIQLSKKRLRLLMDGHKIGGKKIS